MRKIPIPSKELIKSHTTWRLRYCNTPGSKIETMSIGITNLETKKPKLNEYIKQSENYWDLGWG